MKYLILVLLFACASGPAQNKEKPLTAKGYGELAPLCDSKLLLDNKNLIPYEEYERILKKNPRAIGVNANYLLRGELRVLAVTKNFYKHFGVSKNIEVSMESARFVPPYNSNKEFRSPIKTTIDHTSEKLKSCVFIDLASTLYLQDPHGHAYSKPPFLSHIIIPD